MNGAIRDKEVRVVGAEGEQLGVMSSREALQLAEQQDLDLVKIAPQASPPVCRIMDYGKFRFEQQKKEKEVRKNQKVIEMKEIRLSLKIDTNDFNTKVGHAIKFLKNGCKVKVSIRFRGREMAHANLGLNVMRKFAETLAEHATVEKPAKQEGRSMMMFLVPVAEKPVQKPKPKPAAAEAPKAPAAEKAEQPAAPAKVEEAPPTPEKAE